MQFETTLGIKKNFQFKLCRFDAGFQKKPVTTDTYLKKLKNLIEVRKHFKTYAEIMQSVKQMDQDDEDDERDEEEGEEEEQVLDNTQGDVSGADLSQKVSENIRFSFKYAEIASYSNEFGVQNK